MIIDIPLKDFLAMLAILFSPLVALWVQGKLDTRKVKSEQRLNIFRTLMATRASVLSFEHIKALNMIDIEFYGDRKYSEVRKAWRAYLHIRSTHPPVTTEAENLQFNKACENTLTELLVKMGDSLGYEFDETHIRQSVYKPQAHVTEESYQAFMKGQLRQLFSGEIALPMDIRGLPVNPEVTQEQKELRTLAIKYLKKELSPDKNSAS